MGRFLLGVALVVFIGLAALGGLAEPVTCKPAPCGCEGQTSTYGSRAIVCTQQGWQHDPR